jgi:hypothetical protein
MNNTVSDAFWYDDLHVLWRSDRLTEFFPSQDHTVAEKLNAIVRLAVYISILLYFHHNNPKYVALGVGAMLLTYYIYVNRPAVEESGNKVTVNNVEGLEIETSTNCTKPSIDNPFMNVTMKDYLNIDEKTGMVVDRPEACDANIPDVKKTVDEFFNNNLFRDVDDVFGKMNSQRQFYTMPSTTIPNKQDEFARWLYASPKTCKEDQEYCLRYEDVRQKQPIFVDASINPAKKDA